MVIFLSCYLLTVYYIYIHIQSVDPSFEFPHYFDHLIKRFSESYLLLPLLALDIVCLSLFLKYFRWQVASLKYVPVCTYCPLLRHFEIYFCAVVSLFFCVLTMGEAYTGGPFGDTQLCKIKFFLPQVSENRPCT